MQIETEWEPDIFDINDWLALKHPPQKTDNMRKVSKKIAEAFKARQSASLDNSRTDGQAFYLHGNKIAEWRGDELWISTAGWDTSTTRERLNAILWTCMVPLSRVHRKAGQLHLNGEPWDGGWVKIA
jgi:hypothetical protein